jgi:hypothetical protein
MIGNNILEVMLLEYMALPSNYVHKICKGTSVWGHDMLGIGGYWDRSVMVEYAGESCPDTVTPCHVSSAVNVHVLYIQNYCCKVDHTTDFMLFARNTFILIFR